MRLRDHRKYSRRSFGTPDTKEDPFNRHFFLTRRRKRPMRENRFERYRPQLISRLIDATFMRACTIESSGDVLFINDALIVGEQTGTYRAVGVTRAHVYFLISPDSITTPERHYDLIALSHFRTSLSLARPTRLVRSFLFPSWLFCLT